MSALARWLARQRLSRDDPRTGLELLARARLGERARGSRLLAGEQSNTSYLLDEHIVCKLLRRLEGGPSVEVELLRALAPRARELGIPELIGTLELPGSKQTLASFTRFIPNRGTAWEHAQRSARRARAWSLAARSGRRTAALHRALAEAFGTRLLDPALESRARLKLAARSLAALARSLPGLPAREARLARALLRQRTRIARRLTTRSRSPGIRVHGDLHLGQVLITERDLAVIDFEGEPLRSLADRRRRRSPASDVAGMLRSFHYAAPDRPTWVAATSEAFLAAYLRGLEGSGLVTKSFDHELRACSVEKALYEIAYELEMRPGWVRIPLQGLLELL